MLLFIKYNLFPACLCNWFGQNKPASIYSKIQTFQFGFLAVKFSSKHGFSDPKTNVCLSRTVIEIEK